MQVMSVTQGDERGAAVCASADRRMPSGPVTDAAPVAFGRRFASDVGGQNTPLGYSNGVFEKRFHMKHETVNSHV